MIISKPNIDSVPAYFRYYIEKAPGNDLLFELEKSKTSLVNLIKKIPEDKGNYRYADKKWSIKEVIRHIIDTERIFTYRALRFSRKDKTILSAYEQDPYVEFSFTKNISLQYLLDEFIAVRDSSILLFKTMDDSVIDEEGKTNEAIFTPRIIGWKTIGHGIHHAEVIEERYFDSAQ